MDRLQIIDSTTITLFSNLLFKGVGRHPKTGKKKGGIKVHTVIHANEGIPSDIKFYRTPIILFILAIFLLYDKVVDYCYQDNKYYAFNQIHVNRRIVLK